MRLRMPLCTDLVEKVEKFNGTLDKKRLATKAQIVKTWTWLFGEGVTGHSGQRTGALKYICTGWSFTQVARMGRWKSSAILSYAGEALEQLPANLNLPNPDVDQTGITSYETRGLTDDEILEWKKQWRKEITEVRQDMKAKGKENEEQIDKCAQLYRENPGTLPERFKVCPAKWFTGTWHAPHHLLRPPGDQHVDGHAMVATLSLRSPRWRSPAESA